MHGAMLGTSRRETLTRSVEVLTCSRSELSESGPHRSARQQSPERCETSICSPLNILVRCLRKGDKWDKRSTSSASE